MFTSDPAAPLLVAYQGSDWPPHRFDSLTTTWAACLADGTPRVAVVVVSPEAGTPNGPSRDAIRKMLSECSRARRVVLVLEGEGAIASLKRAFSNTMIAATGRRYPVDVVATFGDALAVAREALGPRLTESAEEEARLWLRAAREQP